MGRMKELYMSIQELVWTAYELGARDVDTVYAYVYQYEPRASEQMVEDIWNELHMDPEAELLLNSTSDKLDTGW